MKLLLNQHILKSWNKYWFSHAPLFNLAICRMIIVAFQLSLLIRKNYLGQILRHAELPDSLYNPLLVLQILFPLGENYRPELVLLELIFWVTLVAGILSLLGLKTNFSLMIFALGNVFIQAYLYSFNDFHHPEALMIIALIILALSPAGGVLSLDHLGYLLRKNNQRREFRVFDILEAKSTFAKWSLTLVQWMFAIIYFDAAMSKLEQSGLDWMNGYTLRYYLLQDGLRNNLDFGVWLSQQNNLVWLSSWMAILFEATFFCVLIFRKLAWIYLPLGTAFHTGIYLAQKAPFFQFITLYVVFIPWTSAVKILSRFQKVRSFKNKPEIIYDGLSPICIRLMTVLSYFDWFKCFAYSNLEIEAVSITQKYPSLSLDRCRHEMYLVLPNGSMKKGFLAFRKILKYLPPLWPLLAIVYLPGTSIIGSKIYRFL